MGDPTCIYVETSVQLNSSQADHGPKTTRRYEEKDGEHGLEGKKAMLMKLYDKDAKPEGNGVQEQEQEYEEYSADVEALKYNISASQHPLITRTAAFRSRAPRGSVHWIR